MNVSITHATYLGYPCIRAENGLIEVTLVPELGSNVIAIKDLETGLDLLRTPETREAFQENPYLNGIPVLFPPNRLEDGKLPCGDAVYQFDINEPKFHNHIHGLVHDKPWRVVGCRETEAGAIMETEIDSAEFPEILRQFPHRFRLRLTVELVSRQVNIQLAVENASDSPFPWGVGYHTTFQFPIAPDGDLGRCRMTLTANRRWELNHRLLPTGVLLDSDDLQAFREGICLVDKPLDDVFHSTVGLDGRNACVLTDPDAGIQVRYGADDQFLHWVVYNADSHQGYVCPEPYTWVTNAPNLSLDPALTGLRVLAPGEVATTKTQIEVCAIRP